MVEKEKDRNQFNLWIDQEDLDWINSMCPKFPFKVSANEFIRQVIKDARFEQEHPGALREPSFKAYFQ
jgi:hypothetical protein